MSTNVSAPIAVSNEIPRFDLSPNAHRIASDEEALGVARKLAAEFAVEAAERDRERRSTFRLAPNKPASCSSCPRTGTGATWAARSAPATSLLGTCRKLQRPPTSSAITAC
jgi:hypothetical protein